MKISKILIIFICAAAAVFALGATGTIQMAKADTGDSNAKDRMIGVLVTPEYLDLFDMESYFNDNAEKIISGGEIGENESMAYQGRLYATLKETTLTDEVTGEREPYSEYVFEDVKGMAYFSAMYGTGDNAYHGSSGDPAISDGNMAISSTDAGDSISLEGTIYVSTTSEADSFYYNPVYQTANGEVYAMTGQGMSFIGDRTPGISGSHELSENISTDYGDGEESIATNVKITVCYVNEPQEVSVIQLDGENNVLHSETYAPGNLPQSLTTVAETEYIIVQTESAEGATRELYQKGEEVISAFCCRDDGICIKQYCDINWNN